MNRYLERAKSNRATCAVCAQRIAKGQVRTVEQTIDRDRSVKSFAHLTCAIEMRRDIAHDALTSRLTSGNLVGDILVEVSRLDPKLANEVRASRARRVRVARQEKPLDDPRTAQLLAQLEATPWDRELLAVLADHLIERGDDRGELIVLDLAASTEPEALARRRELSLALSPQLERSNRAVWGVGFLRKLYIHTESLPSLGKLFAHPSCRLLEAIDVNRYGGAKPVVIGKDLLPRSLRSIVLAGGLAKTSDISTLPFLEHVHVDDFRSLAHPTLPSLELDDSEPDTLRACDPASLPNVRRLAIRRYHERGLVDHLVRAGWLERLSELELASVSLDLGDLRIIEIALAGRKLARLAVSYCGLTRLERPRLEALCDVLEFHDGGAEVTGTVFVEHTGKPEWGRGKVMREHDGKIEVAFESGTRTFKADAPFLRHIREG